MTDKRNILPESILFQEISTLIEQSQLQVVSQVNSTLTLLFWQVGQRTNKFILAHKRAEYGQQIIVSLSRQLEERFGRSFGEKNLRRMLQFAALFPEPEKVVTLSRQLS